MMLSALWNHLKWDICSCNGQSSITSDFIGCVSQQMVTLQCGLQRLKVGWSNEVICGLQKKKHQTLHEGMEMWLTSITLFLEKISACANSRYKAFDYAYFIWTMSEIIGAGRVGGYLGHVPLLGEILPHTALTRFKLLGVVTCVTSFTVSNHWNSSESEVQNRDCCCPGRQTSICVTRAHRNGWLE